jgi:hypothetical protein
MMWSGWTRVEASRVERFGHLIGHAKSVGDEGRDEPDRGTATGSGAPGLLPLLPRSQQNRDKA